jgi:hypothetical protein
MGSNEAIFTLDASVSRQTLSIDENTVTIKNLIEVNERLIQAIEALTLGLQKKG